MKKKLSDAIIMSTKYFFIGLLVQFIAFNTLLAKEVNAQLSDTVAGNFNTTSLKTLFSLIKEKTDLSFIYDAGNVNDETIIHIKSKAATVANLLDSLGLKLDLSFKKVGNTITVKKNPLPNVSSRNEIPYLPRSVTKQMLVPLAKKALEFKVTGTVTDSAGNRLIGVSVQSKGGNLGTVTNAEGHYELTVSRRTVLVFSYVGYAPKEVTVQGEGPINVVLSAKESGLNEVVVVGYGTQKKEDLTGSIASVSSGQLAQRPVHSFEDALGGLAPGIDVAHRSGAVGNVGSIFIRGIGSISANTQPLFVVDGFPTDANSANAINPADIQSIEILKDASATAIYGSRGANGVILITTKSGKPGKLQVNVSVKAGFARADKNTFYPVLNGAQYVTWYKEKAINDGKPIPDFVKNWDGTSTNWQDVIYRTAPFQDYTISASGGSEKTNYLFSAGYVDQQDILLSQGFKKYATRGKLDFKPSNRITFGINLAPTFTVQNVSAPDADYTSLTGAAVLLPPIIPVRNQDGSLSDPNDFGILKNQMANPLEIAQKYKGLTKRLYLMANAYAQVEIIKGLNLRSTLGANIVDDKYRLYQEPMNGSGLSPVTSLNLNSSQSIDWLNENTLDYKKLINGVHSFDLLLGYTVQKSSYESVTAAAKTFPSSLGQTIGFGNTKTAGSGDGGNSLLSYLARLNYDYKGKYLLTATVRRDGSSRFGANRRWGIFPSIAAGWNLSNENFIRDNFKFIDKAKIRASYGTTGSNFIGDFTALASLRSVNHSFNGTDVLGFENEDPGNPDLSWEVSRQVDIGLDAQLFKRISLTFDYYNDVTQDLLLEVNVPPSTGYSGNLANIGRMRKWGFELAVNANIVNNSDWGWDIGFNVTNLHQKVLELGPTGAPLRQFYNALVTPVGGHLEEVHVLKQIGILSQDDIDKGVAHRATDKAGDIKFLDYNGDGTIDAFNGADGVLMGDNNPSLLYGANTAVRYKNFRLSALINGQGGAEILDFVYQLMSLHNNNTNMSIYFYNGRYVSAADPGNGWIPRAGYTDQGAVSSWEIQSTNYLRIRNIDLTYSFPAKVSEKLMVNNLKAYVSVENVLTVTKFEGGNPQATRVGSGRIVGDGRTLSLNSVATPPLPRIFTLGVNFSF